MTYALSTRLSSIAIKQPSLCYFRLHRRDSYDFSSFSVRQLKTTWSYEFSAGTASLATCSGGSILSRGVMAWLTQDKTLYRAETYCSEVLPSHMVNLVPLWKIVISFPAGILARLQYPTGRISRTYDHYTCYLSVPD